ncbi:kinase-like domain-containing protein [Glomus cerebriforme]|uniref:Kinase-like domain-containing protein n=1 Tax=Glomus cerebriforme TaxID=658196 RepID=A0A397TNX4_9GLOM|nr:kinase-like domain-containing protein [Glomus cerebriforme]
MAMSHKRSGTVPVIIKFLKEKVINLLDWCRNHYECLKNVNRFYRFYGLTLNPMINQYGTVFQYNSSGTLREYLKNNQLKWQEKVDILYYITHDLATVHKAGLYHGFVTTYDILMNGKWAYLTGLDFSKKINTEIIKDQKIFGVFPFASPEVLRNNSRIQPADIYSLGIVMSEIASGDMPYSHIIERIESQNSHLFAISICNGLRPKIKDSTPKAYSKIMKACWDPDPSKRPDIFKLKFIFTNWRQNPPYNITEQFELADSIENNATDQNITKKLFENENNDYDIDFDI